MTTRFCALHLLLIWLLHCAPAQASEEWQLVDRYENIELYRQVEETDGYLPFKAVAELASPYQKIVMALIDSESKHLWAPKLKWTAVHSQLSPNEFEFSEYYTTPWPFSDREFLLSGQVIYHNNSVSFVARNSPSKELARDDHVLVDIKTLTIEIVPLALERTRIEFTFSGNMGGWIPEFVQTIIQKKWPVRFIQALEKRIQSGVTLSTVRYEGLFKRDVLPQEN